jgi:hypothetical protein
VGPNRRRAHEISWDADLIFTQYADAQAMHGAVGAEAGLSPSREQRATSLRIGVGTARSRFLSRGAIRFGMPATLSRLRFVRDLHLVTVPKQRQ